jgi:hypothetical protein
MSKKIPQQPKDYAEKTVIAHCENCKKPIHSGEASFAYRANAYVAFDYYCGFICYGQAAKRSEKAR